MTLLIANLVGIAVNVIMWCMEVRSMRRIFQYRAERRQIAQKYRLQTEKLSDQSVSLFESAYLFMKMGLTKEAIEALNSTKVLDGQRLELFKKWDEEDIALDKRFGYKPVDPEAGKLQGDGSCPLTTTK